MSVLYNTGKVKIGLQYMPRPMPITSRDAIKLQSALLDNKTAIKPTFLGKLFGAVWRWL